ncbi:MAG: cupredoxin domain-containing protein [Dehalococcoidia bacterium]
MRTAALILAFFTVVAASCGGDSSPEAAPSSTATAQTVATARPTETPLVALSPTVTLPAPTATPEPPLPTATAVPAAPVAVQPTIAPPPTVVVVQPTPVPPPPAAPPPAVTFAVTASQLKFSASQLSARSGASVTVSFRNEDAGVAHDVSFGIAGLGHGHTCAGPCTDSYSFVAPAPGTYDFFCTVHIDMTGKLIVSP